MKKNEHKIGETFEHGDVLLKVERAIFICDGCYFKDKKCWNIERESCMSQLRSDRQNVVFVETLKP